jgi:ribosomal protein S14
MTTKTNQESTSKTRARRVCQDCGHASEVWRKKGLVFRCALSGRVVLCDMATCQYWMRRYGDGNR